MAKKNKDYKVWEPANIYPSANIGKGTVIGAFSEVGKDVKIGMDCKIGSGSFIPEGVTVGNRVFLGPGFVGTNDKHPRSTGHWVITPTKICDDVTIGANSTILPGVIIEKNARVGAGSVVTKSIKEGEVWFGNPARRFTKIK